MYTHERFQKIKNVTKTRICLIDVPWVDFFSTSVFFPPKLNFGAAVVVEEYGAAFLATACGFLTEKFVFAEVVGMFAFVEVCFNCVV